MSDTQSLVTLAKALMRAQELRERESTANGLGQV